MDAYSANVAAFPLMLATVGERVRIVAIGQGRGIDRKLADLGLTTGSEVTIMTAATGGGSLVVARDDVRLALGRGIAHRLLVVRVEPTHP